MPKKRALFYAFCEKSGLVAGEGDNVTGEVYVQKTRIRQLKSTLWPMRELVASFMRSEHRLLSLDVRTYIRDSYDHSVQALEAIESLRETSSSLMDLHLSATSRRTNEVMKTLTIFAALFIPLTFLAGVYGMNFVHMPELAWRWAYPAFWVVTVVIAVAMLVYFKVRRWW
jgi:Mg2+ and Co2+ transporters